MICKYRIVQFRHLKERLKMIKLSIRGRTAACNSIVALVDVGTLNNNGYISIFTAPRPSSPESPIGSATRLAIVPLAAPAFGTATDGQANANGLNTSGVVVDTTGTPSWFRVYDKDNNSIWDGDVALTGSGGDMEFNDLNFIKDGKLVLTTFNAIMPQ